MVARPAEYGECVIKAFELSTETVAFLFQVFYYRAEICHEEILAGYSWRQIGNLSNSQLV